MIWQKNNIQNIFQKIFKSNNIVKRSLQMSFDVLAIMIALIGAMLLRLETFKFIDQPEFFIVYTFILFPTLIVFAKVGLYRGFIRYVSTEITVFVALGTAVSAILLIIAKLSIAPFISWSIPIIYSTLLFILVTGSRFILRAMFRIVTKQNSKNIAIYGAGVAGAQLVDTLESNPDYNVQIILDDKPSLQGQLLYGRKIMSFDDATKYFDSMSVDTILLALPNISMASKQKMISKLNDYKLKIKTIPSIESLINGSKQITELRDFSINDLLGRKSVEPLPKLMDKNIRDKVVLVTGAGGSIGSELCRQTIQLHPKKLLLLDLSELAMYIISSELQKQAQDLDVSLVTIVGSLQDRLFVKKILEKYDVDTVFHAAAYKHVPLMEQNVIEAVKNNTLSTMILAEEAVTNKVTNFTLISTDKAVNPTNVMGASKRLAEKICQGMNFVQKETRFSIVRFGNVLGSSGSVVPLFQKQIAAGGPITLTHPDVIRYFMTITEAVQLVIQASSLSKGGEIFVLDMGIPVKIKDLAFNMVKLLGLRPYIESDAFNNEGDIEIRITGLRPGEKMYEELSYDQNLFGTIHPRIMMTNEVAIKKEDIVFLKNKLETSLTRRDYNKVVECLKESADYIPNEIINPQALLYQNMVKNTKQSNKFVPIPIKFRKS
ncbi:nucleoside-diphosphate sugar epimerase/dehydratase [Alphaproteobacteria bacterium]|nr:nucleoside-diphosphate sugar epimerase/dehydratase [Alphaproteobacteria bacterium]